MSSSRIRRPAVYALGLAFLVVGTAVAAAPGDPLRLGVANSINALTRWAGSAPTTALLRLSNTGGGPALDLRVNAGKAPLLVNSGVKVRNLNVDRVDGLDSTALQRRVTGTCTVGEKVTAITATGAVVCENDATDGGNAQTIDGLDSTQLQRPLSSGCGPGTYLASIGADGSRVCNPDNVDGGNATTLDGRDGSEYVRRCTSGSPNAIVSVWASSTWSATYTSEGLSYESPCLGPRTIKARRVSAGLYHVWAPAAYGVAVGNATEFPSDDFVIISRTTDTVDGVSRTVFVVEVRDADGGRADVPFNMLTY